MLGRWYLICRASLIDVSVAAGSRRPGSLTKGSTDILAIPPNYADSIKGVGVRNKAVSRETSV
jgi:hypothetical protein